MNKILYLNCFMDVFIYKRIIFLGSLMREIGNNENWIIDFTLYRCV